ncbi:MAG: hypothetical protein ACLPHI_13465 [Terriglobales bacterium]|jgi:hypothetical protein
MPEKKTERSACRFTVQQASDGKPFLAVQLYHDSIPRFKDAVLGFDLLGGMRVEAARKLADSLNEHVIELFVTSEKMDKV